MKNKKNYLYIAASLMFIIAILRGLGGLLLLKGADTLAGEKIDLWKSTVGGVDLLIVALLLILSSCLLIFKRNKTAWILSWVSLCLFIIGGIVNGFLLFGKPQIDGQIVNWSISILAGVFLALGKKDLAEK